MRSLKDVYPEFAKSVDFYAVNTNPAEGIESLVEFAEKEGYPWQVAQPSQGDLARLNVRVQSTKVAFGSDGVIVYRDGFGGGDVGKWREVLDELGG